jgi:hypothetical protein
MDSGTDSRRADEVEERLRRAQTIREVLQVGEWLTVEQLDALRCPMSDWKRQRLIFSVEYEGREFFARYQFDSGYQPLPIIQEILTALGDISDLWAIAAWFHYPSAWLVVRDSSGERNVAPKDVLSRTAEVVAAAAKRSGSYVA